MWIGRCKMSAVLAILALGLWGASPAPVPTTGPSTFDYDRAVPPTATFVSRKLEGTYTLERLTIKPARGSVIPASLCLPSEGSGPFPVVLLIHGVGERKETMLRRFAAPLTRNGIACIGFDLAGHGERTHLDPEGFQPALARFLLQVATERGHSMLGLPPGTAGNGLSNADLRTILQGMRDAVVEARMVLDYLQTRTDIDGQRMAVEGVSMGGTLAVVLGGNDERVKAVIANIAGAWTEIAERYGKDPQLQTLWQAIDPSRHAARISPRPVLMTNGQLDPVISRQNAEALYAHLREPREIRWYPSAHSVSARAVDDGLALLCKTFGLAEPKPRPAATRQTDKPVASR